MCSCFIILRIARLLRRQCLLWREFRMHSPILVAIAATIDTIASTSAILFVTSENISSSDSAVISSFLDSAYSVAFSLLIRFHSGHFG